MGVVCQFSVERGEIMFRMKPEAAQALEWAAQRGIPVDKEEEVVATVLEQEVVSYSSEKGTVSFDLLDIELVE
jgi:hypothetical protein